MRCGGGDVKHGSAQGQGVSLSEQFTTDVSGCGAMKRDGDATSGESLLLNGERAPGVKCEEACGRARRSSFIEQ